MSQFWFYFQSGLEHILDWNAYDHILFLIVLAAAYSFHHWKVVLWLVTIFTLGHTIAHLLSVYDIISVNNRWVELLIALTILITALYNILTAKRKESQRNINLLYSITAFFGIIHGFGFSLNFKRSVSGEDRFLPILEFALGIEAGQIIVALVVMILALIAQNLLRVTRRDWILVLSSIVIGIILPILRENLRSFL